MGVKTKEMKATYKKWQKLNINLDKYLCLPCEIDEELYNYLGEIVPPQYCDKGFVQLGECQFQDKYGTDYYMTASMVKGKFYYLGVLPEFKQ